MRLISFFGVRLFQPFFSFRALYHALMMVHSLTDCMGLNTCSRFYEAFINLWNDIKQRGFQEKQEEIEEDFSLRQVFCFAKTLDNTFKTGIMEIEKVLSSNGQLPLPRQIICKKQTTA